ncbi:TIGR01621 family pseudouridine synthase [Vibrio pectenicida]|uniref:TIGR01621 family pseudouridine synthase n=1 Tax=Vibrio pectenicida TaxID=62763 RepID=A0A3R9F6A1_9VIBR|nr:TIGR01621 family pseudouridine synthase [Vibrio pectenicida]RSD30830.1 TIGR01621 family pseudouridine synthase [Vibrio pectenicida]
MFDIIFCHSDFIVINKHPNVSVHKDEGDSMLLQDVAASIDEKQLYLVHRLDKMTSGLLLLGRNRRAASELSKLFSQRRVEKYYLAIGSKKPKKKQGLIRGDMERSRRSSWKLLNTQSNPAVTQFFSVGTEPSERLFICKPHTGKTHQIRVALKSIGSPIVGDRIYNPTSDADRGYLHAFAIIFDFQGQSYRFVCDPRECEYEGDRWCQTTTSLGIQAWLSPWTLPWPPIKQ